ncbi:formylglycine-generating enzyme family protein [bacterium]|nr:formylglycine-generating enzyme family protein [bacterium]
MNLFNSAFVCVAVFATCISEIAAETPTTATAADSVKLPESTNSIGMKFKLIPAGTFIMGEGDDAHEVTLTEPFQMGVHEVTQAQYEQVMGSNPSGFKGADNPVETVLWKEAMECCRKLSSLPDEKAEGNVYRLPTEAEWEYACRAGTTTTYSFGDNESELGDHAWYADNSGKKTHPVGGKQPNAWGLYDMHGNILEFCQKPSYGYPQLHVLRGGGWYGNGGASCRSVSRQVESPYARTSNYGFRVILTNAHK